MSNDMGALEGIRVLEFSQIVAAPIAGVNLSDMGADVIKVEPVEGESTRRSGGIVPLESKGFQSLNRGKRSLPLNLRDDRAKQIVYSLIPDIDVVTINYRLGVAERLGIDYETLKQYNPKLIYWENTGFGATGPGATRAGTDLVAGAYTGLIASEGHVDEVGAPERGIELAIADFISGYAASMGICAALFHRERTGEGQLIRTSLLRSALHSLGGFVMREPMTDSVLRDPMIEEVTELRKSGAPYSEVARIRKERRFLGGGFRLFYNGYRTSDGAIMLGCLTKASRDGVRRVLELDDEHSDDPDYDAADPVNKQSAFEWRDVIREKMLQKTESEWMAIFDAEGVPASTVHLPEEMSDDPQVVADGIMWDIEHSITGPQRVVGPIVEMFGSPTAVRSASPALGEDTEDILTTLGYDSETIQKFRDEKVTY